MNVNIAQNPIAQDRTAQDPIAQDVIAQDLIAQDRIAKDLSTVRSLDDYYAKLVPANMEAGWNKREPTMYPTPKKAFLPAHWPYRTARAALDAAARLVGTQDAERRNLILHNPLPGNNYGTAPTLVAPGSTSIIRG